MALTELNKYTYRGEFLFYPNSQLSKICNAPYQHGGLYLIYAEKEDFRKLVYIGISGRTNKLTGKLIARKDGLGGRIVKGKRDGKPRKYFWIEQMLIHQLDKLRIVWFVVHNEEDFYDCPESLERQLIEKYEPIWNRR